MRLKTRFENGEDAVGRSLARLAADTGVLPGCERRFCRRLRGEAEVSTAKRELVTRLVQARAIADSLASDFIEHGVLTGKGRARRPVAAYLDASLEELWTESRLAAVAARALGPGLNVVERAPGNVRSVAPDWPSLVWE